MSDFINQIEKKFAREKGRVFSKINKITNKYRSSYNEVLRELNRLRTHESSLKNLEKNTAAKVRRLSDRIRNMIERERFDKRRILQMTGDIKRMREEIPKLHRSAIVGRKAKEKVLAEERKLISEINRLERKIETVMNKKTKLGETLRELTNKENLLKAGKIYWKIATEKPQIVKRVKRTRSRSASKPRPVKRKSLFNQFFR